MYIFRSKKNLFRLVWIDKVSYFPRFYFEPKSAKVYQEGKLNNPYTYVLNVKVRVYIKPLRVYPT